MSQSNNSRRAFLRAALFAPVAVPAALASMPTRAANIAELKLAFDARSLSALDAHLGTIIAGQIRLNASTIINVVELAKTRGRLRA